MKDSPLAVAPSVDLHGHSFFEIKLVCNFFHMNYECILFKKKKNLPFIIAVIPKREKKNLTVEWSRFYNVEPEWIVCEAADC